MINKRSYILLILAIASIWACDTKDNIQPRNDDFFVKFYAGITQGEQEAVDVIETSDGGLLIAGTSDKNTADSDILLIKTDSRGNELWKFSADTITGLGPTSAKSILEIPDIGYLVGGTALGTVSTSIILKINFDGSFADSIYVNTPEKDGTPKTNRLSKITLGESGVLVSGETFRSVAGLGASEEFNGYVKLLNPDLSPKPIGNINIIYFGLSGNDFVTGAYELEDSNNINMTNDKSRFLAFGASDNQSSGDLNYYYIGINDNGIVEPGISSSLVPESGQQIPISLNRFQDKYWLIGSSERNISQIYMIGWEFRDNAPSTENDWVPVPGSGTIPTLESVAGKSVSVQADNKYVIVGDISFTLSHQEIYLARVSGNFTIESPPWPKTYGTLTSTYSVSAVTVLQDGSIVIAGTAELDPIKKIVLIKTGPDGQMSF